MHKEIDDYECFYCNNIIHPSLSWYYRGCWHQTFPELATRSVSYAPLISITSILPMLIQFVTFSSNAY